MGFFDLAVRPLFRPRVTVSYPGKAEDAVAATRMPRFEPARCTDDRACMRACPTKAIVVETINQGSRRWTLDYGACLVCGECIRACPSLAIAGTGDFELASASREGVVFSVELEGLHHD